MRQVWLADRSIGRRSSPGLPQDVAGMPLTVSFFAKFYPLPISAVGGVDASDPGFVRRYLPPLPGGLSP
jgi:hypothetical protein